LFTITTSSLNHIENRKNKMEEREDKTNLERTPTKTCMPHLNTQNRHSPTKNLKPSEGKAKGKALVTKAEAAMMLALWAQYKKDCKRQRTEYGDFVDEFYKNDPGFSKHKRKLVDTGACVVGEDDKIILVEGSRFVPVAKYIATRFTSVLKNSKVYLSKYPCVNTVKTLIQAKVAKIIVPYFEDGKEEYEYGYDKDEVKKVEGLITTSSTGLSKLKLSENARFVFDELYEFAKNGERESWMKAIIKENSEDYGNETHKDEMTDDEWLMACGIIVSMCSKDPNAKVGSVLAEFMNSNSNMKTYHVIGIGYNGTYTKAMSDDFKEEQKEFYIHAEENAMMFRSDSLTNAYLYSTYSSCNLCAPLIVDIGIKKVFHVVEKATKPTSDFHWEFGRKVLKQYTEKGGLIRNQIFRHLIEYISAHLDNLQQTLNLKNVRRPLEFQNV
jgi:deoxycytidylate deaminase